MAKPEWGTKRICPSCGARYYDLGKALGEISCPKCGSQFDPEAFLKVRRARVAAVPDKETTVASGELDTDVALEESDTAEEDEIVADEAAEDEDDELIEDASELGEDEDDMAEVIENVEDEEER